jgi:hypothetical protein
MIGANKIPRQARCLAATVQIRDARYRRLRITKQSSQECPGRSGIQVGRQFEKRPAPGIAASQTNLFALVSTRPH